METARGNLSRFFMEKEEYYSVGRVKEAHGLRGELYVKLRSKRADWLGQLEDLILSEKEKPAKLHKFSVVNAKPHRDGLVIKTKELTTRTEAENYKGYYMFIPVTYLITKDEKDFYLFELMGFEVIDQKLGSIGKVTGFGFNGAQDLLKILGDHGDVEVPLVNAFIDKLDFNEKKIFMNLPEGLVEVNAI